MAFNDALFQLGMDLTRSSTAQKEDHGEVAHVVAHSKSTSPGRESARNIPSLGTSVTIDVYGIGELYDVETALTDCIAAAGATLQHVHFHPVPATGGVSGMAILGNGHISFHSRPRAGYASITVTTFERFETHRWVSAAKRTFGQCQIVSRVHSGEDGDQKSPIELHAVMPQRRQRIAAKMVRVKAA